MKKYAKDKNRGFTLTEMIVVLVILAILAAFTIPAYLGFVDRARGGNALTNTREISLAASSALVQWVGTDMPGNGDAQYKINIETMICNSIGEDLGTEQLVSHELNKSVHENAVMLGLSQVGGQWNRFKLDCKNYNYKNYAYVFMHKSATNSRELAQVIDGIYYVSPDGQYVARIVYSEGTKLGDPGSNYEKLE